MLVVERGKTRRIVELSLAAITVATSWHAVSWALVPGLFLWMDEIGNLTRLLNPGDWLSITILPKIIYNDRPAGFVIARLLFDAYGFDYLGQLHWFLLIHAANLVLGFLLFRRLGIQKIAALAAIACYGMLSTTAQAATYIGAVFDVTCSFFILCSILAFLNESHWMRSVSVVCFFLALRTKEIAIVLPILLAILAFDGSLGLAGGVRSTARRLWPHFAVWLIFIARYVWLIPRAAADAAGAYHISVTPAVIASSYSYYTRLVFGVEDSGSGGYVVLALVVLLLAAGFVVSAPHRALIFAVAAYVLILLPVAILPGIRAPFYLYAPQMFLLLGLALTVQGAADRLPEQSRFWAILGAGLLSILWAAHFRESAYFTDRVAFMKGVRTVSARTASQVWPILPSIAATNKIAIYSDGDAPWLFVPGPCYFVHVVTGTRECTCTIRTAPPAEAHPDANLTVLRYLHDGSIIVDRDR